MEVRGEKEMSDAVIRSEVNKTCSFLCNDIHEELGHKLPAEFCVIHKRVLSPGEWGPRPTENAECKINITDVCCTENTLKEIRDMLFSNYLDSTFEGSLTIGEADMVIDRALEQCVQSMVVKEKSVFSIKFPSFKSPEPVNELSVFVVIMECSIYLDNFVNDDAFCDWSNEKVYVKSMHHKTQGVDLFKKGKTVEAFIRFSKGFKFLNTIDIKKIKGNELNHIKLLLSTLLNNMASCQLQFQNYQHSISLCSKALAIENNVKSLYRRAIAYIKIQEYDNAEEDLKKVLDVEPNNVSAKEKYNELKELTKEINANYASMVKKMFS